MFQYILKCLTKLKLYFKKGAGSNRAFLLYLKELFDSLTQQDKISLRVGSDADSYRYLLSVSVKQVYVTYLYILYLIIVIKPFSCRSINQFI